MYLLAFYVPETHLDQVKDVVFRNGGGKYKNYDCCCFQTHGEGQFRPLQGSTPYIGTNNTLEKVTEYKVELIVEESCIDDVISGLLASHPYEEVAYHYFQVHTS